jgi:hypothetical protein
MLHPSFETHRFRDAPQDEVGDAFAARLARKRNLACAAATKQHDGQNRQTLSSPSRENIPLNLAGKSPLQARPVSSE